MLVHIQNLKPLNTCFDQNGFACRQDCLSRMQCTAGKDAWKGRKAAIEEVVQACAK